MQIELLKDPYEIKSIITHPKLFPLTYGQHMNPLDFQLNKQSFYVGICNPDLIGLFEFKEFTKITLETELFILPQYQVRHITSQAIPEIKQWLKSHTTYRKLFVQTPLTCVHIIRFLNSIEEFKVCGKINNGIIYNHKLQDLLLYEADLYETNQVIH